MNCVNLSYIVTTYNKHEYLIWTLPKLIQAKASDEEIIVVDGGSNDGAKEYLQSLYNEKKIDKFISEPDKGQGEGNNKAILMASGILIKIITDDDIYNYKGIRKCKEFMLANANIDFLFANIGDYRNNELFDISYQESFLKWQVDNFSFGFCDLGLMIRKSSVTLMGLFNPEYINTDYEYSIRITNHLTTGCYYTGYVGVRILNEKSLSSTKSSLRMNTQKALLAQYYRQKYLDRVQTYTFFKLFLLRLNNYFEAALSIKSTASTKQIHTSISLAKQILFAENWLNNKNSNSLYEFHIKVP